MDKVRIAVSNEYIEFSLPDNFDVTYFDPSNPSLPKDINGLCIRSKTKINKEFLESFSSLRVIISATSGAVSYTHLTLPTICSV